MDVSVAIEGGLGCQRRDSRRRTSAALRQHDDLPDRQPRATAGEQQPSVEDTAADRREPP